MSFKYNPFTGTLDFYDVGDASPDNFSKFKINESVVIPDGQEMIVSSNMVIDDNLEVSGNLIELSDYSNFGFSFNTIKLNKAVKVPTDRDMLYYKNLNIDGLLIIEGNLIEV